METLIETNLPDFTNMHSEYVYVKNIWDLKISGFHK